MARTIRYEANCYYCARRFQAGQAFLQKSFGQWFCHCFECYKKKNKPRDKAQPREKKVELETITKELATIGKSLRIIGTILETGASVEAKRLANGAYDDADKKAPGADVEEKSTINAKKVKAAAKKAAPPAEEDDENFDLGDEEAQEDEVKAVTKKDLIAACRDNREAAIKVLKKMKVASVHELKPAQYAKVLEQIGAN